MSDSNLIDASPTKEFFISMITRDIPIDRAILDLIDNSIDAANRDSDTSSKKEIKINFDAKEFTIFDNCGGISLDDAINYAFRFGRSSIDDRKTPHSVGQFGVGMKRTLFKLGNKFSIETHNDHNFKIDVNVKEWIKEEEVWNFHLETDKASINKGETLIKSYDLFEETIASFENQAFENKIKQEIEKAHFTAINNGLNIYVNNNKLEKYKIELKQSEQIRPVKKSFELENVTIVITAGIAERNIDLGGWYIICNGRLIEEAEQTSKTGWGDAIRKYHPDFAFFRGIVEFTAEDASKLPWTTTKTGIDTDHRLFRYAYSEMRKIIKPILKILSERAKEEENKKHKLIPNAKLNEAITQAKLVSFQDAHDNTTFIAPNPAGVEDDSIPLKSISYKVTEEKLSKIREALGNNISDNQIGLRTFEYYLENECE